MTHAEYMRGWRASNPEKNKQIDRKAGRKWRKANPDKERAKHWRQQGIEPTKAAALQQHACEICGKAPPPRLHVDHNHVTGEIRGSLCGSCNRAIGLFKDSPRLLINALHYLQRDRT